MQHEIILTPAFSNPLVEAQINNLGAELTDRFILLAKEDAEKEFQVSEQVFNTKVKEVIFSKVQACIDVIKSTLLVSSVVFDAAEIDRAAQKKIQRITNEINDYLQTGASLKRKRGVIVLDPLKKTYSKWLIITAVIVGLSDAILAFSSFRNGSYSFPQALLAAAGIGAAISVSHLTYTAWVKQSKNETQRIVRIVVILVTAFVFFAWLGNLRAAAANASVNIALDGTNVSAASQPHYNGWGIAVISFGLFATVLFLSLVLWKTKEERVKEEEYDKLSREIAVLDKEILTMQKEKTEVEKNAIIQKSEARKIYDYALASIRKCKSIGTGAIILYKQTYARFANNNIPAFFAAPVDLAYDESFNLQQNLKPEQV
jgi:hypothetical protein